jgi:spore coat protein U-like protein
MFKLINLIIYIFICYCINFASAHAATCSISKAAIAFGTMDTKKTIQESTGNITIVCSGMTGDIIYSLALTNPDKNLSMSNGKGGVLFYQLYTSANYVSVWSQNKVINGLIKNINGNGSDTLPFYGRIIIQQNTSSGNYTVFTNPPLITLTY